MDDHSLISMQLLGSAAKSHILPIKKCLLEIHRENNENFCHLGICLLFFFIRWKIDVSWHLFIASAPHYSHFLVQNGGSWALSVPKRKVRKSEPNLVHTCSISHSFLTHFKASFLIHSAKTLYFSSEFLSHVCVSKGLLSWLMVYFFFFSNVNNCRTDSSITSRHVICSWDSYIWRGRKERITTTQLRLKTKGVKLNLGNIYNRNKSDRNQPLTTPSFIY